MFISQTVAYDTYNNRTYYNKEVSAITLNEAKKVLLKDIKLLLKDSIIPKEVYNAVKHAIAVAGAKGFWCRFRADTYWLNIGIDVDLESKYAYKIPTALGSNGLGI